jgi:hypothetical protein
MRPSRSQPLESLGVVAPSAYTIEILLEPRPGGRRGVFDLTLIDRVRQNIFEGSVVDLDLAGKSAALCSPMISAFACGAASPFPKSRGSFLVAFS